MQKKILVEVSARHIHLSQNDLDALFGKGYELKKTRSLTQLSDFAAEEVVQIETEKGKLSLRIVGPAREETQIELSATDALKLGIEPVLRVSGDIKGSPGAYISGPQGQIDLKKGVIIAARHLHCNPKEAESLNLKNKQTVSIEIKGKRALIFNNISVRVKEGYRLAMHIDTDEGNAAGIDKKSHGFLIL